MAKFDHLYSTTSGHVPSNLGQGQVAVNLADKLVYSAAPDGNTVVVSSGNAGISNVSGLLNSHIKQMYHPVIQFCPGYSQAQCQAAFTNDGTTATLKPVPIYAFGQTFYTPQMSCSVINGNTAFLLTIDFANRGGQYTYLQSLSSNNSISGTFNPISKIFNIIIVSENTNIYPWFYVPAYIGNPNGSPGGAGFPLNGNVSLFRLSSVATFGAIPISTGFPGYTATADTSATTPAYWGKV